MSNDQHDLVLVVDFGAQYAQLIARRVREAHVFSEIVPHTITAAAVKAKNPTAIVLSGGPKSVNVDGAPLLDPEIYDLDLMDGDRPHRMFLRRRAYGMSSLERVTFPLISRSSISLFVAQRGLMALG